MTLEEGRVFNFLGESMSANLLAKYLLLFLYLKKESLRSLGDVRLILESILQDMMLRAVSPSREDAHDTVSGFGFLTKDGQYGLPHRVFSRNLVTVGKDGKPKLLHLYDVGTDWSNDRPELIRLLKAEMRKGESFPIPNELHPLCLNYAGEVVGVQDSGNPDVLARLIVESKMQNWHQPVSMRRWTMLSPNTFTTEEAIKMIVDREFVSRP